MNRSQIVKVTMTKQIKRVTTAGEALILGRAWGTDAAGQKWTWLTEQVLRQGLVVSADDFYFELVSEVQHGW